MRPCIPATPTRPVFTQSTLPDPPACRSSRPSPAPSTSSTSSRAPALAWTTRSAATRFWSILCGPFWPVLSQNCSLLRHGRQGALRLTYRLACFAVTCACSGSPLAFIFPAVSAAPESTVHPFLALPSTTCAGEEEAGLDQLAFGAVPLAISIRCLPLALPPITCAGEEEAGRQGARQGGRRRR